METVETKTTEVVVNGAARTIPVRFKIDGSRVAVERHGVVRNPEWPAAAVHEGAHIEVVWFQGGGPN